jgi:hypothetical protein
MAEEKDNKFEESISFDELGIEELEQVRAPGITISGAD